MRRGLLVPSVRRLLSSSGLVVAPSASVVFAIVFAVVFLGEAFTLKLAVGGTLIVVGALVLAWP